MDFASLKAKAKQLKSEVYALYLASKDPRTPWYAKVFAALIISYALSPIDLIPDFIPFLGYLDDLVIVPAGVLLLLRMIPNDVMEECRKKAQSLSEQKHPKNWIAGLIIVLIWLGTIYVMVKIVW
jgi:uncharacterized membrane protein YkvA (DUF1232 family)